MKTLIKIESLTDANKPGEFLRAFVDCGRIDPSVSHPAPYEEAMIKMFHDNIQEMFLALDGFNVVGRIGAFKAKMLDGVGYFGMLVVDEKLDLAKQEEVGLALMDAAQEWLKSQEVRKLYGPICYNVWLPYRYKVDELDKSYRFEPNNRQFHLDLMEKSGLKEDHGFISKIYDTLDTQLERTKPAYDAAIEAGMSFREMNPSRQSDAELLYSLNIASFTGSYLYEPISFDQYEMLHLRFISQNDLKHSRFILDPNGKELGYLYAYESEGILVLKSLLTRPTSQNAGLASALVHEILRLAQEEGITKGAGAMVRKGNVSEKFFDKIGKASKELNYALFYKELETK